MVEFYDNAAYLAAVWLAKIFFFKVDGGNPKDAKLYKLCPEAANLTWLNFSFNSLWPDSEDYVFSRIWLYLLKIRYELLNT